MMPENVLQALWLDHKVLSMHIEIISSEDQETFLMVQITFLRHSIRSFFVIIKCLEDAAAVYALIVR